MIYDEIPLWGLTDRSPVEEVWEKSFQYLAAQGGRVSIATVRNGLPDSRIISIQRFSDGGIYFMTSRGKPFYRQLKAVPRVALSSLLDDTHHCIRIRARVEEQRPGSAPCRERKQSPFPRSATVFRRSPFPDTCNRRPAA